MTTAASTPAVSVILPTRGRPYFFAQALGSVLSQSWQDFEIIVISADPRRPAADFLSLLPSAVSAHFIHSPGATAGAARNAGLRLARGRFIAFLDDDDFWLPGKLAQQLPVLEANPSLGLVSSAYLFADASGTIISGPCAPLHFPGPLSPRRGLRRLLCSNALLTSSVIARRECFSQAGLFDESLPLAQDWDLWLRLVPHWQVQEVSIPLVAYRLHSAQHSRRSRQMRECEFRLLTKAWRQLHHADLYTRLLLWRRLAWGANRLARARRRERCWLQPQTVSSAAEGSAQ